MRSETLFNLIFEFPKQQTKKMNSQGQIQNGNLFNTVQASNQQIAKLKQLQHQKLKQCNYYDSTIKNIIKQLNRLWKENSQQIQRVCYGNSKLIIPAKLLCDDSVPSANKVYIISMFALMISSSKVKDYLAKINILFYIYVILLKNWRKIKPQQLKNFFQKPFLFFNQYFKRKDNIQAINFLYSWIKMGEKSNKKIPRLLANLVNIFINGFDSTNSKSTQVIYATNNQNNRQKDRKQQVFYIIIQISLLITKKDLQTSVQSGLLSSLFKKCVDCEFNNNYTIQIIQTIASLYNNQQNRLLINQTIDLGKMFAIFTNVDLKYGATLNKNQNMQSKVEKTSKIIQLILGIWPFCMYFLKEKFTLKNFISSLKGKNQRQLQIVFQNIFDRIIKRTLLYNEKFISHKRKYIGFNHQSINVQKKKQRMNEIFFVSNCLNYRDLLIIHSLLQDFNLFETLQQIDKNRVILRNLSNLIIQYFPKIFIRHQDSIIKHVSPLKLVQQDIKRKYRQQILELKSFCMDCVIDYQFSMTQLRDYILFLVNIEGVKIPQQNKNQLFDILEKIKKQSVIDAIDLSCNKKRLDSIQFSTFSSKIQICKTSSKNQSQETLDYPILFQFYKTVLPTLFYIPWQTKYLKLSSFLSALLEQLTKTSVDKLSYSDQLYQIFDETMTKIFSEDIKPDFYKYLIVNILDDFAKYFSQHETISKLILKYYQNDDYVYRISRLILHLDDSYVNFKRIPETFNTLGKNSLSNSTNLSNFNATMPSGFGLKSITQNKRDLELSQVIKDEKSVAQIVSINEQSSDSFSKTSGFFLSDVRKTKQKVNILNNIPISVYQVSSGKILQKICIEGTQFLIIQTLQFIKRYCIDNQDKSLMQSAMRFVCQQIFNIHSQYQEIIKTAIQFCEQLTLFEKSLVKHLFDININKIKFKALQRRAIYIFLDTKQGFKCLKQNWPSFLKQQIQLWMKSPHQHNLLKEMSLFMNKQYKKYSYLKDTQELDFGFGSENRKKLSYLPWSIAVNNKFYIAMAEYKALRQRIKLRSKIQLRIQTREITVSVVNIGSNFIRHFSDTDNDSIISIKIQEIQKAYSKIKAKQRTFILSRGIATLYFNQISEHQSSLQFVLQKVTAGISLSKQIEKPLTFPLTLIPLLSRTDEGMNFLNNESGFIKYLKGQIQQQRNIDNVKGSLYCLGNLLNSRFLDSIQKMDFITLFMNKMIGQLKKDQQNKAQKVPINLPGGLNIQGSNSNQNSSVSINKQLQGQSGLNNSSSGLNVNKNNQFSIVVSNVANSNIVPLNNPVLNSNISIQPQSNSTERERLLRSQSIPLNSNLSNSIQYKTPLITNNLELIQLYFWLINILIQNQECRKKLEKQYSQYWEFIESKNGQWLCFPSKILKQKIISPEPSFNQYDPFHKIKRLEVKQLKNDQVFLKLYGYLNEGQPFDKLKSYFRQGNRKQLLQNSSLLNNVLKYISLINFSPDKIANILDLFSFSEYLGSQKFDNDFQTGFVLP